MSIAGLKRLLPKGTFFDCEYIGNNRGVAKELKGTREVVSVASDEITLKIHGGAMDKGTATLPLKGVTARVEGEEVFLAKNDSDFYKISGIRKAKAVWKNITEAVRSC